MSARTIWDELVGGGWSALTSWVGAQKGEGLHLDFKQAAFAPGATDVRNDDKKNLAKTLSGYGNTEGGVLVLGGGTSRNAAREDFLSDLTGITPLSVYAERLRALVRDITTPTIPGVVIEKFEDPARQDTGVVGVFVPLTDGMPYRAEGPGEVSGRYYIRTTTDTTVMPHQILAALFGRVPQARLRIGFDRDESNIRVFMRNEGTGTAVQPFVRFELMTVGADRTPVQMDYRSPWEMRTHYLWTGADRERWSVAAGLPSEHLIYPDEVRLVGHFPRPTDPKVRARIDSAGAPPRLFGWQQLELGTEIKWLHDENSSGE